MSLKRHLTAEITRRVTNAAKEVVRGQKRFWEKKLKRRAEK